LRLLLVYDADRPLVAVRIRLRRRPPPTRWG